eukprot:3715890-Prymnesium_polylepis.1
MESRTPQSGHGMAGLTLPYLFQSSSKKCAAMWCMISLAAHGCLQISHSTIVVAPARTTALPPPPAASGSAHSVPAAMNSACPVGRR